MKFSSKIVEGYNRTFFPAETAPKDGTLIKGLIALDDLIVVVPSLYWDVRKAGWYIDRKGDPIELRKWYPLDALVAETYNDGSVRH